MNLERVEKIANAVLYEGYILYPYRASSVKNRQRWNFGALCPPTYSEAQGGTENCLMQTECLVVGDARATLDVKVRFLHLLAREVGVPIAACEFRMADSDGSQTCISDSDVRGVPSLEVGGQIYQTWQEAVEREVNLSKLNLHKLAAGEVVRRQTFNFPAKQESELLREPDGRTTGVLVRKQQSVAGAIELQVADYGARMQESGLPFNPPSVIRHPQLYKVTIRILNLTALEDASVKSRDEALMRSLVSTHTILNVNEGGAFVSLLEPPAALRELAASCRNTATWPVLAGEEGETDCMLSSPIILYDYPQIAPESAGDLFDGTEIDEILTLRIMTLTDAEKHEMRGVDERARRLLERTEQLPAEELMKLHGAMRAVGPREEDER
jgi:hypothetical protein